MIFIDIEDLFLLVLGIAFALFLVSTLLFDLKKGANYAKKIRTSYYCNVCVFTFVDLEEKAHCACPRCGRKVRRGLRKR